MKTQMKQIVWILFVLFGFITLAHAQGVLVSETPARLPRPVIIIMPPHPPIPPRPEPVLSYKISALEVNASLKDLAATVNLSQTFVNTGSAQMEVSFVFPIPYDAAVEEFTLLVDGKEIPAKLQKAEDARKTYEEIVRKIKDPALLEWVGNGLLRSSVFPVPAGESRTIQLKYTQLCKSFEGMTDFLFPLGAGKFTTQPIENISVKISIENASEIRNVYCPTLDVKTERPTPNTATVSLELKNTVPTADFRLMYDIGKEAVQTRVLSYRSQSAKDASEDGYFLILATPEIKADEKPLPKSVFFVLDNSGSMMGEKIQQAKKAASFVLEHLSDGDIFNIIVFNSSVTQFQPEPLVLNAENRKAALAFIEKVYASGGTDIHSALLSVMEQIAKTDTQRPNYILFLTDGCPTVGTCDESKITQDVKDANTKKSRIFAFGAGYDLNSRLLDKLVTQSSGQSEYIRPEENIEECVSRLYRKLHAPILSDASLKFEKKDGGDLGANRIYPAGNFDIFGGEQLAISGRYHTSGAGTLVLTGKNGEQELSFAAPLQFVDVSGDLSFAFVEKLWAVRRIGEIIDELDLKGKNDELVQELIQLSTKHGILTPYTSFLAEEGTVLHNGSNLAAAAARVDSLNETQGRFGVSQRKLKGGFRNAQNMMQMEDAQTAYDADNSVQAPSAAPMQSAPRMQYAQHSRMSGKAMQSPVVQNAPPQIPDGNSAEGIRSSAQRVRNIQDRAFFFKNGQWVDSTLTEAQQNAKPIEIERFSTEYFDLISKYGTEIAPYLVFEEPILVNVDQQAYLIRVEK